MKQVLKSEAGGLAFILNVGSFDDILISTLKIKGKEEKPLEVESKRTILEEDE